MYMYIHVHVVMNLYVHGINMSVSCSDTYVPFCPILSRWVGFQMQCPGQSLWHGDRDRHAAGDATVTRREAVHWPWQCSAGGCRRPPAGAEPESVIAAGRSDSPA